MMVDPPATMKAAQAKDYGDIDEMLSVEDNVPYPTTDLVIVKAHAVAVACGDVRVLSGRTRELQGPPSLPYIPGGDVCGTVVQMPKKKTTDLPFQLGDRVAARFCIGPCDALAEYAIVHPDVCDKAPDNLSSVEAAALAGACPATLLGERIRKGERVLILGASGGVGTLTSQIMRLQGASYIAGVTSHSNVQFYDRIIDYTKQSPFEVPEFRKDPFDVVVDLAGVGGWLSLLKDSSIVKPASQGGRYLTLTPDSAIFDIHSIPQALHLFLFIPLWRAIKSRTWCRNTLPKYTFAQSIPQERTHLTRTLQMASQGKIRATIAQIFPFTTEDIRKAFRLQETRHAHGKVVIEVSQEKK